MYMKSHIGRTAGSIISMQPHVAQAAIINGTHSVATIEEIAAANLPPEDAPAAQPEAFPAGYTAQAAPGGFEIIGPDGAAADDQIYPNLPAARGAAAALAAAEAAKAEPIKTDPIKNEEPPPVVTEDAPAAVEDAPAAAEDTPGDESSAPSTSRRRR